MTPKKNNLQRWRTVIDVLLVPIALFRVVVGCTIDVAMAFKYPMGLAGCEAACVGKWCEFNCRLRALLHVDMLDYFATGVDPVSASLGMQIRLMTGFYFACVGPFMIVLVLALWTKREAIRVPAIVVGATMAALMVALIARNAFGHPPSRNLGWFILYNIVDVAAPILILTRVVPRPLFVDRRS